MDEDKHIERQVALWLRCEALIQKKIDQMPTFEMTDSIYHEVNKWLISDRIQTERKTAYNGKDKKPKTDIKCRSCDNFLTEGEKKYCDDHDQPYKCYKCTKGS